MHYTFSPKGVCAMRIDFEINNGTVSDVEFIGGCNGNLKAISRLVEGKNAIEIADILEGNTCNSKSTSCADQLSIALREAAAKEIAG